MKLRCLIPNFHIHVSVSDLYFPRIGLPILRQNVSATDLYIPRIGLPILQQNVSVSDLSIPRIGLPILLQKNRWTDPGNRSQIHECGIWELGRAVSFLGIHESDLLCSAPRPVVARKKERKNIYLSFTVHTAIALYSIYIHIRMFWRT
jgi:hypothetical protein